MKWYEYTAYYKNYSVAFTAENIKIAREKHPEAKVVRFKES